MTPGLQYANEVVDGERYAGPLIVAVCERAIAERSRPPRHLEFDEQDALYATDQARRCNVKLGGKRVPFEPLGWQHFLLEEWAGWRVREKSADPLNRETGTRRYRTIFLLTGKGSGKSVIIAPLTFMMMMDDADSEVYCLGPNEEIARRPWREMKAMIAADERLGRGLHGTFECKGGTSLSNPARMDCYAPGYEQAKYYSVGKTHLSGPIPNLGIVEEYQGMLSTVNIDELEDGCKQRDQALMVKLANAGRLRQGPCWDEYVKAGKMIRGQIEFQDDYLPLIYELPEEKVEAATAREKSGKHMRYTAAAKSHWEAANPSYPTVIRDDYITKQLVKARAQDAIRASQSEPYRLIFSIWPKSAAEGEEYLKWEVWQPALREPEQIDESITPAQLAGCRLYLGLDLANVHNFTALAKVWQLSDLPDGHPHRGKLLARVQHYTPGVTLGERARRADEAPFELWAEKGFIKTEPGNVSTYDDLAADLAELVRAPAGNVAGCAFDRRYFPQFQVAMEREALSWIQGGPGDCDRGGELVFVDHIQTLALPRDPNTMSMPTSMKNLRIRLAAAALPDGPKILIEENPFLNWQVSHAIEVVSANGGMKIGGVQSEVRAGKSHYDGLVALTMAVGLADYVEVQKWSPEQGGGWSSFSGTEWAAQF